MPECNGALPADHMLAYRATNVPIKQAPVRLVGGQLANALGKTWNPFNESWPDFSGPRHDEYVVAELQLRVATSRVERKARAV